MRCVDLFCGGGGASEGIRMALGVSPELAVNHSPAAIEMHAANHPETRHIQGSVWEEPSWKLLPTRRGRPRPHIDLLWASPDCFPAGTMILTIAGFRPIEDVLVGELVLTHKGRWRPVTATMTSRKKVRTIRGHGHPGLTVSDEHPFWTTQRTTHRKYRPSRTTHTWAEPAWKRAADIDAGDYWATPTRFEPLQIPVVPGRGLPADERLWWLAGRYVADGWTRITDTRGELVLTIGKKKAAAAREALGRWPRTGARCGPDELTFHERSMQGCIQFSTSHRGLVGWLRDNFGHLSHGKTIPGWLLGAPEEVRQSFLDGYLAGDGYKRGNLRSATTVSPSLVWGLRCLLASMGYSPACYKATPNTEIEGRTVNAREGWRLRWREAVDPDHKQTHHHDGKLFSPIREVTEGEEQEVYNLSVAEDESYIADSIVVHNCTHFSRARGGRPRKKNIRDLPWIVVQWARDIRPQVIGMENVAEILSWGPLDADGKVIAARKGETWGRFVAELRLLGYQVDWRVLNAADYGAPTSRRRLFLVARCDGEPVCWPEPTHGPGCAEPYRTAAEHIDWNIPCPSIFLSPEEAKTWAREHGKPHNMRAPKRPLADNTLRRIAAGIQRYVLQAQQPFLLNLTHGGRLEPLSDPMRTIMAAHRGEKALVSPYIARIGQTSSDGGKVKPVGVPLTTVTSKAEHLLVAPHLTKFYGTSSCADLDVPAPTITGQGQHLGLVAPYLVPNNSNNAPQPVNKALGTITTGNRHFVLSPSLIQVGYGERRGQVPRILNLQAPLGTVPATGNKFGLVSAYLAKHNRGATGQALQGPLHTITGTDTKALVSAWLMKYYGTGIGQAANEPLDTVPTRDRFAAVQALLQRFAPEGGNVFTPTLLIGGERYAIADIGMRMLTPEELAACQGFGPDYTLTGTKTQKVARIGNSVPPQVVAAVVGAQFPQHIRRAA